MKKILFLLLMPWAFQTQGQSFRNDAGLGLGLTLGHIDSYGASVFTEPKYFFSEHWSIGTRLEYNAIISGTLVDNEVEHKIGLVGRGMIALKGEYYYPVQENNALFASVGFGYYGRNSVLSEKTNKDYVYSGDDIGFSPELGYEMGKFRISAMYHMVLGHNYYPREGQNDKALCRNYFVLNLGFKTFGS